jgi:hypothetical protein
VAQAFDPGAAGTLTRVADGGKAEGALVSRPGHDDALVIFNARPAPDLPPLKLKDDRLVRNRAAVLKALDGGRRHTGGFEIAFTAAAPSTLVLFADLDGKRAWSASVDGGAAKALAVSEAGVARVTITGPGPHKIAIR